MMILGFFFFTSWLIKAAVRPELENVEKPRTSGFSFSTHLAVSSIVNPLAGWSSKETSMPSSRSTAAKYMMPSGGKDAIPFRLSLTSRSSFGLELISENFISEFPANNHVPTTIHLSVAEVSTGR